MNRVCVWNSSQLLPSDLSFLSEMIPRRMICVLYWFLVSIGNPGSSWNCLIFMEAVSVIIRLFISPLARVY